MFSSFLCLRKEWEFYTLAVNLSVLLHCSHWEMCGCELNFLRAFKIQKSSDLNRSVLRTDVHGKSTIFFLKMQYIFDARQNMYLFEVLSHVPFLVKLTRMYVLYCVCPALEILKPLQKEYAVGSAVSSLSSVILELGKGIMLLHIPENSRSSSSWALTSPASWEINFWSVAWIFFGWDHSDLCCHFKAFPF